MTPRISKWEQAVQEWTYPSWRNLLVLLPWAIGVVLCGYHFLVYGAVAQRQQTASGVVTAHEPGNHNCYRYRFKVEDKTYGECNGAPNGSDLQIGQGVRVYYDPLDPETSSLTDFYEVQLEAVAPVPFMLFGIGAVTFYILWRRSAHSGGHSGKD